MRMRIVEAWRPGLVDAGRDAFAARLASLRSPSEILASVL